MSQPSTLVPCPVCRSNDVRVWYHSQISDVNEVSFSYTFQPRHMRTFQVVRCMACTHAYCSPLPDEIAAHYEDVVDDEYLRHRNSRLLSSREVIRSILKRGGSGRLLDIGCATGDFLDAARESGFDTEGLELSSWSSKIAREKGLIVHQERLEAFTSRNEGRFDVITLIGVIEHFSEPAAEMERIRRLLRPGGMVVLWTGDVDSITSRLTGRRWWYWQGQHIQYFTRRSLELLCSRSGLETVGVERYPFAATSQTINNSLRRYPLHGLLSRLVSPAFALKPIWNLRIPGELLLFARRSIAK